MVTTEETRAVVVEQLSQGERLIWFWRPSFVMVWRPVIFGFLIIAAIVKGTYFEAYLLLSGAFPSIESSRNIDALLIFLFLAAAMNALRRRPPRRVRRAGDRAYALTDRRLIIVRVKQIDSIDKSAFDTLEQIRILRGMDLEFKFRNKADEHRWITLLLYGLRDPGRVACLVRHILAPHTLARNLEGVVHERTQ